MKRFFALLLVLVAYFVATTIALADTIVLPGNLTRIESEAFAELRAEQVKFPSTIEFIADDAFLNASFVGTGEPNTYAQAWCEEHGFEYVVATSPVEDFEWETINGIEAKIVKYIGTEKKVYIPSLIEDYDIVEIASKAFYGNTDVEYVFIPNSVRTISSDAFRNCTNLSSVRLNKGIETISDSAFRNCDSLEQFTFPETLTKIGNYVLADCDQLSATNYPINAVSIGKGTFSNDPQMVSFKVAEGIETLNERFFDNNKYLSKVILPATLKTIGEYAFEKCTALAEITLPEGLTSIYAGAFYSCTALNDLIFPEGLKEIRAETFAGCIALTAANLPDSLEGLGEHAFDGCVNLESFHYPLNLDHVVSLYDNSYLYDGAIFKDCKKLKSITVPEGVAFIPEYFFRDSNYLKSVILPSTLEEIRAGAFEECISMRTIAFPDGLKEIYASAFQSCTALNNLTYPSSLKTIRAEAFAGCTALTAANLPDNLEGLGEHAFDGCINLESFHYPLNLNHVVSLYDNGYLYDGAVFKDCEKLKSITVPEGVTFIPEFFFKDSNYLNSVILPSTLEEIHKGAFQSCTALKNLTFPSSLKTIRAEAFAGCTALTAANLPDNVQGLGEHAFDGCINLESFHYPLNLNHVVSLYDNGYLYDGAVFKDCEKLTSIDVPNGVTEIPDVMFQGSNHLQTVTLPSTLTTIGGGGYYIGGSFADCLSLSKVYIGKNVTSIADAAFENCPNLTIWCEYNSVALQHAIDHSIPYYYLSPDGINSPSGTLYKGDTYAIYGYARSSNALTDVTATIWDSTGTNAIQTISVKPGTKDLNLAGDVNAHLHFAALPLGNYRYTLTAQTEISEEIWANSSFTVAPPPLRVSVVGMKDLSSGVGNDYTLSGTIYSNYPITKVTVTLKNISADITYPSFTASPNTTTYSLSKVTGIDFSDKPTGKYQLSIVVNGNGESRTPKNVTFGLGAYDGEVDSEVFDQLISFVGDISNRKLFDKYDEGSSFLASLSPKDTMLMTINFRSQMCIDVVGKLINGDDLSRFMVKRYKKEIAAIIDDVDKNTKVTSSDSTYNKLIDSMVSDMRITFTFNENDSLVTKRMMNMSKILNFQLDKIEKLCDINGWIMDAKDYYSAFLQNYENSLLILEIYSGYGASKSPEFRKAVEELANDYESKVVKALNILTNLLNEKLSKKLYSSALDLFEAATDMIDKKLTGSYGDYSILLSIVNFAIDASMEFNNYDNVADSKMDALIRVDTFGQALDSYHEAFDVVHNGDTSTAALNRLGITYQLCCTAGTRMYDALAKTAWYETNFAENNVFMDRYSELWRMEYDEPFDNWR